MVMQYMQHFGDEFSSKKIIIIIYTMDFRNVSLSCNMQYTEI